jgi:hypothetical protein
MDFKDLYQKIREIDQSTDECGEMSAMPSMAPQTPPPSMSVNLNASGMENIESLLKLMTKVNPDMMPKGDLPMPKLSSPIMKLPMDMPEKEEYANEPDEEYDDISASIPDGDDLHKSKKGYAATAGGDNPRAVESQENLQKTIKEQLLAALDAHKKS